MGSAWATRNAKRRRGAGRVGSLVGVLESGLLKPPLSDLSLQPHLGNANARPISELLGTFFEQGMTASQVAVVLRAFACGRELGREGNPHIEVVVSGPDLAATARDTGVVIRQLFESARKTVLAVGFAVHQGKSVFEALARRLDADETLEVILCLDVRREPSDTSLDQAIVDRFAHRFVNREWPGERRPCVFYDPRSLFAADRSTSALHAKCVAVDRRKALVTSANFTEAAQQRNTELGLLVESPLVAGQIEAHFRSLIENRILEPVPLPKASSQT
ncbi:MAG: DISARM system phospholipase D-like protein DrmC [Alphaproteobacteria bacterium]|nr:DISARM system phospholipase D-like protein DrmC [Alphaproteobacteria bacterium]MCY4318120.1 DISARM system phospholipase D-like protein DrmC [Alphaproteobacteria bacterium]